MKIVKIDLAYEVPDDFKWGEEPDIMDEIIDLVCPVNHNEDAEADCLMVSMSGRVLTPEQFDAELDE